MKKLCLGLSALLSTACTIGASGPPLETVSSVDLARYMGDWHVIATIPTSLEKGAHNALEHYDLATDGSVDVRFTFNKDAPDGPKKELTMTAHPVEGTQNAQMIVKFLWVIRSAYYIVELAPDYSWVVVGIPSREHLWIMSRQKTMPEALLTDLIDRSVARGFKKEDIIRVPQS